MEIPNSINVLGIKFEIINETTNNDSHWGHALHHEQKILLYASPNNGPQKEDRKAETLLHEILHVINCAVMSNLDEDQIGRLSRAIFAVIRDNDLDFRRDIASLPSSLI